jgi:hypothetical protein
MPLRKNFGSGRALQTTPFGVGFPLPPFMRAPISDLTNKQINE